MEEENSKRERKRSPARPDARALALEVLSAMPRGGRRGVSRTATEILSGALLSSNLSPQDEARATELVYSTIRRRLTLDWIIEKFSGVPVTRIQPRLLDVLRLGVLQLVFMESVPDYAAVDESVKLASAAVGRKAAGFANSVLRKVASRASSIPFPDRNEDLAEHISVVHSHPRWLVRRWLEHYGEENTLSICTANNAPPPITARVNLLKTNREGLVESLMGEGVDVVAPEEDEAIEILRSPRRLSELESFREGLFYLQDVSTMIPAKLLAPVAGETVLDLCSAPGGKATHMAELMGNRGLIVACDIAELKMSLLQENIERLGTTIVRPLVADGERIEAVFLPEFDRILIDAPCSNTGVLRRRVEARWRLKQHDLKRLQKMQRALLRSASKVLKRGGVLVYSTCSIEPEEGRGVVEAFLEEEPGFGLEKEREFLPRADGGDGGYVARLLKR